MTEVLTLRTRMGLQEIRRRLGFIGTSGLVSMLAELVCGEEDEARSVLDEDEISEDVVSCRRRP